MFVSPLWGGSHLYKIKRLFLFLFTSKKKLGGYIVYHQCWFPYSFVEFKPPFGFWMNVLNECITTHTLILQCNTQTQPAVFKENACCETWFGKVPKNSLNFFRSLRKYNHCSSNVPAQELNQMMLSMLVWEKSKPLHCEMLFFICSCFY